MIDIYTERKEFMDRRYRRRFPFLAIGESAVLCCVSNHKDHLLCGKPDLKFGDDKMKTFILSEAVQFVLQKVNDISK